MIYDEIVKFEEIKKFLENAEDESDLIEVLHKTQDVYGYIPRKIVTLIAKKLDMPVSKIYGVITFYSRFSLVPKGKFSISVCMGTACYVKGAENILNEFSKLLNIGIGETTEDLIFSLIETRCVGECAEAPVVNVNDAVYRKVTLADVPKILSEINEVK